MKKRTIWISSAVVGTALVLGGTAIAFATTDGFAPGGEPPETSDDGGHLTGSDLDAASAAALEAAGSGTVLEAEVGDDGTQRLRGRGAPRYRRVRRGHARRELRRHRRHRRGRRRLRRRRFERRRLTERDG